MGAARLTRLHDAPPPYTDLTVTAPAATNPLASHRNAVIAGGVVLFHVAALWALQSGLLRRAVEVIVPATILSEIIAPAPTPQPPAPQPKPAQPVKKAAPVPDKPLTPAPQPVPAPVLQAAPSPAPSPNAPTAVPSAPATAAAAPAVAAPPAPPRVELPSSSADYLNNPKPAYPPLSKRLGEQGKVVVRVLIASDGTAQQAQVHQSSGFERLDQAALSTVLKWRYVPGKRAGVPEAMWFNVPINFVLE